MTVATKGIPLAYAVASYLDIADGGRQKRQ